MTTPSAFATTESSRALGTFSLWHTSASAVDDLSADSSVASRCSATACTQTPYMVGMEQADKCGMLHELNNRQGMGERVRTKEGRDPQWDQLDAWDKQPGKALASHQPAKHFHGAGAHGAG